MRDVRDPGIGTQIKEQVEPKLEGKESHPDPPSPNSTEYTYEYDYESSSDESQDDEKPIHVKSEEDCKVEHAALMVFEVDSDSDVVVANHGTSSQHESQDVSQDVAFTSHVMPNERTTMGRKHRRVFLEGIDTMNRQDALIRSSFGLVPSDRDRKSVV